jgi:hypothetical protein
MIDKTKQNKIKQEQSFSTLRLSEALIARAGMSSWVCAYMSMPHALFYRSRFFSTYIGHKNKPLRHMISASASPFFLGGGRQQLDSLVEFRSTYVIGNKLDICDIS